MDGTHPKKTYHKQVMKHSVFILALIVTGSCVHEPFEMPCDEPVPEFNNVPDFGILFGEDSIQYFQPVFNPKNSDEFICFKVTRFKKIEVLKYTISTGNLRVLGTSDQAWSLAWSYGGLIGSAIFAKACPALYDESYNFIRSASFLPIRIGRPYFTKTANDFYLFFADSVGNNFHLRMFDSAFNVKIDSIGIPNTYKLYNFKASAKGGIWYTLKNTNFIIEEFCYTTNDTVFTLDNLILSLKHSHQGETTSGFDCTEDGSTLYYCLRGNGIYRLSLLNRQPQLIKLSCGVKSYEHISVSHDNRKILAVKDYYRGDSTGSAFHTPIMIHKSSIVLMNTDGSGEQVLLY